MNKEQIEKDFGEWIEKEGNHTWAREAWHAAAEKYALKWVNVKERLPVNGESVVVLHMGEPKIASLQWEEPGFDDVWKPYQFWDSENYCHDVFEWEDVTHWLDGVPPLPKEDE